MGKDRVRTQNVQQRQTADSTFNTSEFQQQLQEQIQRQQQAFQQQQAQSQAQSSATGVDAASQEFINQMRARALSSLGSITPEAFAPTTAAVNATTGELMNPFIERVVGGVGEQFDRLRDQASMATDQEATARGAFGGSRHGVATGQRLAELDRAEAQEVGRLLAGAHDAAQRAAIPLATQQALSPAQAAAFGQALLSGSLGPVGQVSTSTGTSTGMSSGSSVQDALSSLVNLGFGTRSGAEHRVGTMTGSTEDRERGNLLNDLLAAGLLTSSFV